jgi:hypothetical protein
MALALNPNRGIRHIERDTHRLEPIDPKDKWKNMSRTTHLLLILLSLVVDDVVEAELVDTLGGGDDAEPVTELLLLEVLLGPGEWKCMVSGGCCAIWTPLSMGLNVDVACLWVNSQVLEVATREGDVGNDLDLAIANLGDDDLVTEVADTALDLHAVVEELLEGGDIEDLVASGLRSVDDVL